MRYHPRVMRSARNEKKVPDLLNESIWSQLIYIRDYILLRIRYDMC